MSNRLKFEITLQQGYNGRCSGKVKQDRKMRRSDLCNGMVALCSLRTDNDERIAETSSLGVWMWWPSNDVHISKFEMEE